MSEGVVDWPGKFVQTVEHGRSTGLRDLSDGMNIWLGQPISIHGHLSFVSTEASSGLWNAGQLLHQQSAPMFLSMLAAQAPELSVA